MRRLWVVVCLLVACVLIYATLGVFVVQPIGAVPDGVTMIVTRLNTMQFVDSADAWCARNMGGVNLLCRAMVLGKVAQESTILLRLPYSESAYLLSTGGVVYGE